MSLSVYPIKSEVKTEEFDLFESLISSLQRTKVTLENGDVIIISSKFVANSQGRVIDYEHVVPSEESYSLGKKFQINPKIAEIILQELAQLALLLHVQE